MEQKIYDFINFEEDNHWWFKARTNILKSQIQKYNKNIINFLDVGCGSGFFMSKMKDSSLNVYGVEPYEYKNIKNKNILKGTAEDLPHDDNFFDVVTILDVIEHIQDPKIAIDEIHRVLKKDGTCLITVPALNWIYSKHDKENGHIKRYSTQDLIDLIDEDKFEILKCSYFNTLLFPIEAPIRLCEKVLNRKIANDGATNKTLNNILYKTFNLETKILLKNNLPIGLSAFIIIKKIK
jgi:SAM-dependent methyltransferase